MFGLFCFSQCADNEDHTFCGIVFPIQAKADLPISQLLIRSVAVRGHLGPLTVWVTNDDISNVAESSLENLQRVRSDSRFWTKIYEKNHAPSRTYKKLEFDSPIVMRPGETKGIYIHSAAHHDLAIVYDNSYSMRSTRYSDCFISILSGAAHLSPTPFDAQNIWGWGSAWRDYREFVGQVELGVVYQLWRPDEHKRFGPRFHDVASTILACQRRPESPFAMLPDECIHYILNMCRWDWFEDRADKMDARRSRRRKKKARSVKRDMTHRSEPSRAQREETIASGNRRWRSFNAFGKVREKILDAFSK